MFLNETPHISLRKNTNGNYQIDFCSAEILTPFKGTETAAARSYSTIIGIYTRDESGKKIYLETSGVYSTTTATKHKPRAAAIASHNGYKIISNINPQVLRDLYFYPDNAPAIKDILEEVKQHREILQALKGHESRLNVILDYKVKGIITAAKEPETIHYKNGNTDHIYSYKTNFKYISNIQYQERRKAIKTIIDKGTKGKFKTYKYSETIQKIREC